MQPGVPSRTAERVALRRATHQLLDTPPVFVDPLALRILGPVAEAALLADPHAEDTHPWHALLRAFVAVRARIADEEIARAREGGVTQVVILGAGLDTFAYRQPESTDLRVFEVDHPATQAWKRQRLAEAAIPVPDMLTFVPVDFERTALPNALAEAGFALDLPAVFSWLGVTPYLERTAIEATLGFVAARPAGSAIVFDYGIAPECLSAGERLAYEALARRVERAGEPFRSTFDPQALAALLHRLGFPSIDDATPAEINARYFAGRADGLRVGTLGRIVIARR